MTGLEFTSRPKDAQEQEPVKVDFSLDGEPFHCVLRTDGDAVMEWSEMAEGASDEDINSAAGAAFVSRFFKLMMDLPEYKRFRAHMKAHETLPETLTEIVQALNERMEEEVGKSTERPTPQRSPSSRGREPRDERTLKIISLSADDGEIEYVDPKPRSARRQPQRKRAKRAG